MSVFVAVSELLVQGYPALVLNSIQTFCHKYDPYTVFMILFNDASQPCSTSTNPLIPLMMYEVYHAVP